MRLGVLAVKGRCYSRQQSVIARFVRLEFEEKYDRLAHAAGADLVDAGAAACRRPDKVRQQAASAPSSAATRNAPRG